MSGKISPYSSDEEGTQPLLNAARDFFIQSSLAPSKAALRERVIISKNLSLAILIGRHFKS